jgi:hypothetical protein
MDRIPVSKGRVGGGIRDHAGVDHSDKMPSSSADIQVSKARRSYDYTPSERKMAHATRKEQVRYGTKIRAEVSEKKEVSWGARLAAIVVVTLVVVFVILWFTPFGQTVLGLAP